MAGKDHRNTHQYQSATTDIMANQPDSDSNSGLGRRRFLKATGAGAAGVALAGCRTRQPDSQPTPTGTVAGDSTNDLPLKGETVKFGTLAPKPKSFPIGVSMKNGGELAVDELNKGGSILGRKDKFDGHGILGATVEHRVADAQLSPADAKAEYIRLSKKENCHAIFGLALPTVMLSCMVPMSKLHTPLIITGSPGPRAARAVSRKYQKYKYWFRVGPINFYDLAKAELEFLKLYAKPLGWDRAAVLIENLSAFDPFAELLGKNIRNILPEVPIFKRTSSGLSNWSPIYDKLEAANVDIALVCQLLTGSSAIKQWANQKRDFEFGGINVPCQRYDFWKTTNGDCEHTFTMNAVTPQTTNTPRTQPFMKRYNQKFGTYPVYSGPIHFDAFFVYAKAMANAVKDKNLRRPPTPDEMVEYLEKVRYTHGTIIPEFQFTPKDAKFAHDVQFTSMVQTGVPIWQQWQYDPKVNKNYGTQHSFAPEQNQSNPYTYPDWISYPNNHPANKPGDAAKPYDPEKYT